MNRITNKSKLTSQLLNGDIQLFLFIYTKVRCRVFDLIMPYITYLGGATISISMGLVLILLNGTISNQLGWELLLALGSSHLLVQVIKRLANRVRPYEKLEEITEIRVTPFEAYSFPSGHTTASFCWAVLLSFYLPEYSLIFILLASLVGISRVYLGVHYPSDVVMGVVIGFFFSYFVHFGIFI